jgi:hypothetical protein
MRSSVSKPSVNQAWTGGDQLARRGVPPLLTPKARQARGGTLERFRRLPFAEQLDDVAYVIRFLASDESHSCTGSDFPCEGADTAGRIVKGAAGL